MSTLFRCYLTICVTLLIATQALPYNVNAATPGGLPTDLSRRKDGEDWPTFLGPSGDNKSTETGIITKWDESPPRIVWQIELGESYGTCSISRGRCFMFDRIGDTARLRCLHADRLRHLRAARRELRATHRCRAADQILA